MSADKPRAAYCTGCGKTFNKMHLMINHRRSDKCGGRFLPEEKKLLLLQARLIREEKLREERKANG